MRLNAIIVAPVAVAALLQSCGAMTPSGGKDRGSSDATESVLADATPDESAAATCSAASAPSAAPATPAPSASSAITYEKDVKPIVSTKCAWCHSASAQPGDRHSPYLTSYELVRPMAREILGEMREGEMPPWGAEPPLDDGDADVLARWIAAGMPQGTPPAPIDTTRAVTYAGAAKQILDGNCVGCHKAGTTPPALDTYDAAKIAAAMALDAMTAGRMPKAGPLPADTVAAFRAWIDGGTLYDATGSTPPAPATGTAAGCSATP